MAKIPTAGYDKFNPFVYAIPYNRSVTGTEFSVDHELFKSLLVPDEQYITLTTENAEDFVFATGSSAAFYPMLKDAVASIQRHRPKNKILVYDLGLSPEQILEVLLFLHIKSMLLFIMLFMHVDQPLNVNFIQVKL